MPVSNCSDAAVNTSRENSDNSVNRPLLSNDSPKPQLVNSNSSVEAQLNEKLRDSNSEEVSEKCVQKTVTPDILEGQYHVPEKEPLNHADDTASATMVVPPDGGWGWVVVAASFVCNFIVDGIIMCFGVFLVDIKDTYNTSKAKVALVGSLLAGFYLITGPFVSALANRYGFRVVTICGALLAATGFALSSTADTVEFLCLTYGAIGGIGFGMIYSPSIITVGFYFERWRALATGIAVCGSGIGTFLIAPLSQSLIANFGWKNALLVQAGIILCCVVCGALFRPLKPVRVTIEKDEEEDHKENEQDDSKPTHNLLMKIKMARDEDFRKSASVTSLKMNKNTDYPTAAELLQISERPESAATVTTKLSKSTQSLNLNNMIIGHNQDLSSQEKRLSVPNFQEKEITPIPHHVISDKTRKKCESEESEIMKSHKKRNRTVSEASSTATGNRSRRGTVTECTIRSRRGTITQLDESINRPMYRDDIFFSASLHRLHQYKSERDFMGYTMSVTRLPTKRDLEEEEEFHCCPEAVKRTMATMLDVSLLKSPSFILLCVSGFLTMMGFFTPFMYLKDRALHSGMDELNAVWLLSAIGVTNTVGRILCGVLSSFPGVDALLINNIALTIGGIATILSGISLTPTYQYCYSVLFGLAIACFASLRSILIVDLLGLEKLTNAFGILLLFQGFASFIGAPLSGLVQEYTSSYDASFYLSGSLILVSGIMCYPLNALNRWEKKKRKEAASKEKSYAI